MDQFKEAPNVEIPWEFNSIDDQYSSLQELLSTNLDEAHKLMDVDQSSLA